MVGVDLVIIPDGPNAKVFLNWIRMVKMIRDKEVVFEIFRKVIIRVVETEKVDQKRVDDCSGVI